MDIPYEHLYTKDINKRLLLTTVFKKIFNKSVDITGKILISNEKMKHIEKPKRDLERLHYGVNGYESKYTKTIHNIRNNSLFVYINIEDHNRIIYYSKIKNNTYKYRQKQYNILLDKYIFVGKYVKSEIDDVRYDYYASYMDIKEKRQIKYYAIYHANDKYKYKLFEINVKTGELEFLYKYTTYNNTFNDKYSYKNINRKSINDDKNTRYYSNNKTSEYKYKVFKHFSGLYDDLKNLGIPEKYINNDFFKMFLNKKLQNDPYMYKKLLNHSYFDSLIIKDIKNIKYDTHIKYFEKDINYI